jgi:S-adenosylmethionine:tRNA ribosyltransferase-isomerase
MHLSDFHYELPEELIAQHPLAERDASRMLVVDRQSQSYQDAQFKALPEHLRDGDVVVLNNTRVFPARLRGRRESGGAVELLLLRETELRTWEVLARPARRLRLGNRITFDERLGAEVIGVLNDGVRLIKFDSQESLTNLIDEIGVPPLPPYIKRQSSADRADRDRYQTVYASERGAIAAPTAGLHFTASTLAALAARGVSLVEITLHVGYGTFEPVKVDNIQEHRVAAEWFSIAPEAAKTINVARDHKRRIIAVGTTTARALESAASNGLLSAQSGSTKLTIVPGYEFRIVDALLTNFHLPKSSLLILVCAFAGREFMLDVYQHAVKQRYRFYSYGDCMLIT